jgi:hypothetical protein
LGRCISVFDLTCDISLSNDLLHLFSLQMNESLFPCELSKENLSSVKDTVEMVVKEWGEKSLTELEAEERLSYSCEKVGLF